MAEVVTELQERLLPEYEQMKNLNICSDEQIRDCIRKRESFFSKITQSQKSIRDYGEFIIFEKKMHKLISEKEKIHGKKVAGLKGSTAQRIIRLYREGLQRFPHEQRFWENFIQFSKKSVPHEVSGIYEKMLSYHGDKPSVWCDAALWAYEYSMNMTKVKDIFFRGLQRHAASEALNKTFFDILLMEASKKSAERNLSNNTISEQDIALEQVEVIYQNSRKRIQNISYFLGLLERCEEEIFKNFTAPLQKTIIDDLMNMFPREEALWDALAQRELNGFNTCDLQNISTPSAEADMDITEPSNVDDKGEKGENAEDTKEHIVKSVWQQRTLKRRIELCCNVYQTGAETLKTSKMWTLYINAMLNLNQDMSTQQILRRKMLATAFQKAHESGLMSVEHYCTYLRMLLESEQTPGALALADSVASEAIKIHKSAKLYHKWLSVHILNNDELKVMEIFSKAKEDLDAVEALPIWRLIINFLKTRYEENANLLKKTYKEACEQRSPVYGVLRAEYLDFCMLNISLEKTRQEYDELSHTPPPCMELHEKMASLEEGNCVKTENDFKRWRLCYENAAYYFGKTNTKVWIDFIKFERDFGDPKRVTLLYQRAKSTLNAELVDQFVTEHTLLTTVI